ITKIRLLGVGVLVLLTLIFASLIFLDIIKVGTPLKANIIDSIVILPFDNFTGDEDLEDLFSGMQSMLISDMQRLSNLRIPCWTSSNAYKDANMTVTQIASNLDTKAAIEMGIFSFGDSIGMQCKLISTVPEEKQIWDKVYKVAKSEIYNLNNQVTKDIAEEVKVKLTPQEENLLAESRIVDPEAMDAYAMGQHFLEQASNESLEKASEFFNIAIKNDSSWAAPYAGVALVWVFKQQLTSVPPSVATPIIKENFEKALALDPNSANSHYVNALIAVWTDWDWEKGEKEFLRSLDLNPNDALCRVYYAHFLMIMKRKEEAIKQANMTLKLDPMRPLVLALYSTVMRVYSDYESAITQLEKALSIEPEHPLAKNSLRVAYRHTGNYEKWFELWKNGVRLDQESIASVEKAFREQGYMAAVEEMIKIGENGGRIGGLSGLYIQLENYEKAMDYFEQAYEEHSPGMPYLSIFNIKKEDLSDNARYIELMKKMNLPLE
ncbi:MAG: hypothetical protein HQ541_01350, partial [Mariniphaga sp.]|nr:hypothetical protein [Mariniphaga sp.]